MTSPMPRDMHEAVDWIGSLRARIKELEHDIERAIANHSADLTAEADLRAIAEELARALDAVRDRQGRLSTAQYELIDAALDRARKEGLIP